MAHLKTWYVTLSIEPCEVCRRDLYDIAKRVTVSILCTTEGGSWDTSNKGMVYLNSMFLLVKIRNFDFFMSFLNQMICWRRCGVFRGSLN